MLRQLLALGSALLVTASLTAQSEDFGKWIALFNGKDLTGWQHAKHGPGQNPPNNWAAVDATLTNRKQGGAGNDICTVEEFDDYELEVEYKIPPEGNSGVYLRGQIEIQIYDSHWKIAAKKKLESVDAGAIYGGSFVALKNAQKEPGTWNKYRVLHVGHRITVWHNDVLIQDNIFQDNKTGGAMGHYPGTDRKLTKDRGPLMLQGDHTEVSYRNIRIRPLF
ncbi:MAG: DUF1080 domain-containing protein [Planctomycetota bacterium]|nr:DUF1080 domain-containing protein [Planctomycetota bacterium]